MQRQRLCRDHRPPRSAFTLIEMLVVIGIASLLMTIAVVAIGHAIAGSRETATDATIKKIHGLLQDRMQAFERMDFHQEISLLKREFPGTTNQQAELVVRKWKFKQLFPQTRSDLQLDSTQTFIRGLPPDVQDQLQQVNFLTGTPDETDSAVLLYLALTQSSVLGAPPVDEDQFSSNEVQTNDDGLPMFVDSWGNPLRFYRWPTALYRPTYTYDATSAVPPIDTAEKAWAEMLLPRMPAEELTRDPDDPHGMFPNWGGSTSYPGWDQTVYHDPDTYHTPLIVSAGRDGELGLFEPHDVTNRGHLARRQGEDALTDNISNYRRIGGGN